MRMKFESIDVNSLKNAINSCRSAVNHSATSLLVSDVMNGNIWFCSARNNLKNALSRLVYEYYKDLEITLNKYSTVASYIGEYKEKEGQNRTLQSDNINLRSRLYYEEVYQERNYNPETEDWEYETKRRTVTNVQVERQMQANSRTIENNNNRMSTLATTISNMVE